MSNPPAITSEESSQPALMPGQSGTPEGIQLVKFEPGTIKARHEEDLRHESMQVIKMQTVELLNCQSNMVWLQELVSYVMELRRVVAIHSDSFASLRPYLMEKEEQK